ncbi:MAG: synthase subunit gamma, partial [Bacteroidota bacterium]
MMVILAGKTLFKSEGKPIPRNLSTLNWIFRGKNGISGRFCYFCSRKRRKGLGNSITPSLSENQDIMAGQLKEVRNRIKSVQSTQQITKAMKMVSAAKLRRAQDAITQMRPYAQKLQEMLSNIVSSIEGGMSLKLAEERPVEKVLLIVITSDRGLCGGYNANIVKLAKTTIAEKYAAQAKKGNIAVWNIGKKGFEALT